jgi:hypothetical protein
MHSKDYREGEQYQDQTNTQLFSFVCVTPQGTDNILCQVNPIKYSQMNLYL